MPDNIPVESNSTEVDIWDEDNPRALIHMLPETMVGKIRHIPEEYFSLSEKDLQEVVFPRDERRREDSRYQTLQKIRFSFWREYERVKGDRRPKMIAQKVYTGVCSSRYFSSVTREPRYLAWILTMPIKYKEALEEALLSGVAHMREYLRYEIERKDGRPDHKMMENILKMMAQIEGRLYGAPTQRVDQKVSKKSVSVSIKADTKALENIDEELRQLEQRASQANNVLIPGAERDVTPEEEIIREEDSA